MTGVLELFRIGIGPSSSHTVGPMRAARAFAVELASRARPGSVAGLQIELFGSLASTGPGHGTPGAIFAGLGGHEPDQVEPALVASLADTVARTGTCRLHGGMEIPFQPRTDLRLDPVPLPTHPNGMAFTARDAAGTVLLRQTWFSLGGGFIRQDGAADQLSEGSNAVPFPFGSAAELLEYCEQTGLGVSEVMRRNELASRSETELRRELVAIWRAMAGCIDAGLQADGILPGVLRVRRRASELHRRWLLDATDDPLRELERVGIAAMAVNEENAAGGRVVTAPTNGAAGIIPAVLDHHIRTCPGADDDDVVRFLLAAGAVGSLIKRNASISGAEVGCQGEVGAACAMAAAGLAEVLGGTPWQVENAAEIGLEHNLGLTCDPIAGLVQIPCIERNGVAAVKAITAARMALRGDGVHRVSLDQAIATLRSTGADMADAYKETSRGGLAVNVPEC
jgi:L-serine dehydratase